jgi:hypothetical protein
MEQASRVDAHCRMLVRALTEGVDVLAALLAEDAGSEAGWTALADLAVLGSVLDRDYPQSGAARLLRAVGGVATAAGARLASAPGPQQWAAHVAAVCADPAAERLRITHPSVKLLLEQSNDAVQALGPSWRREEIAFVNARLHGTPLPALRALPAENTNMVLYELAHLAFYTTDFGARTAACPLAKAEAGPLAQAAAARARYFAARFPALEEYWDLGLELVLAHRYLAGAWPESATIWAGSVIPRLAGQARRAILADRLNYLRFYHPMAVAALVSAGVCKEEGGT